MTAELVIFLISIFLIVILSILIAQSSIRFAKIFGISGFALSFILMAFMTSIPELSIGLTSGLNRVGEIAIGAIFGSNIINLTLVSGLIALFGKNVSVKNLYKQRQLVFLLFIAGFSIIAMLDGEITKLDGGILVLGYLVYLYELWFSQARDEESKLKIHYSHLLPITVVLVFSILALLFVSDIAVTSTINLSNRMGVDIMVLSALFIGGAVAMPELVFEYLAVKRGDERYSFGDLAGSIGTNATLIIGLTALISPITISFTAPVIVLIVSFVIALLSFIFFVYTKKTLDMKEGGIQVMLYIIFLLSLVLSTFVS